jgi:hypothetical protein
MRQLILLGTISCLTIQVWGQKTKSLDSVSYFPKSIYSEVGNRIDSMSFIWRSQMLRDFNEPKLLSQQQDNSVYRFTWTRSFHEIMIIRMTISGDSGTLLTKTEIRQPIQQNKKKNKVAVDNKVTYQVDSLSIGQETITQFQTLVSDRGLWEMKNTWDNSVIHDGAGWLLEANDKEKGYKMLYRHSPGQKEQNFRDICLFLIRLTKDSEKLEVY